MLHLEVGVVEATVRVLVLALVGVEIGDGAPAAVGVGFEFEGCCCCVCERLELCVCVCVMSPDRFKIIRRLGCFSGEKKQLTRSPFLILRIQQHPPRMAMRVRVLDGVETAPHGAMLHVSRGLVVVRQELLEVGVFAGRGEGREVFPEPGFPDLGVRCDALVPACELVHDLYVREDVVSCLGGPLALDGAHAVEELEVAEVGAPDDVVLVEGVAFAVEEVVEPGCAGGVVEVVVVAVVVKEEAGGIVVPDDAPDEVVDFGEGFGVVP